jgi:ferric-dicitrate binding protein FerR (iron transport regulator)
MDWLRHRKRVEVHRRHAIHAGGRVITEGTARVELGELEKKLQQAIARAGGGTAIVGVTVTVPGKDTLPDGSVVMLAPHSKIIYTPGLTGDSRAISLEGDAGFSVSRDPARPFVVLAGDIAVRVLGTSFLVRSGPDSTEVMVTTGIVQEGVRHGLFFRPERFILISSSYS